MVIFISHNNPIEKKYKFDIDQPKYMSVKGYNYINKPWEI